MFKSLGSRRRHIFCSSFRKKCSGWNLNTFDCFLICQRADKMHISIFLYNSGSKEFHFGPKKFTLKMKFKIISKVFASFLREKRFSIVLVLLYKEFTFLYWWFNENMGIVFRRDWWEKKIFGTSRISAS